MIGVLAAAADHGVVEEFFELFKTPWEYYRRGREYPIVLCAQPCDLRDIKGSLVIVYGSGVEDSGVQRAQGSDDVLMSKGQLLPIYRGRTTFTNGNRDLLVDRASGAPAIATMPSNRGITYRIGYDLFREIRHLLTVGQPAKHAAIPSLELHIELLRDLIRSTKLPFAEIPPVPYGFELTACLTHDVDHPGIRFHKWDHTVLGFLYRSLLGSAIDLCRNRTSLAQVLRNWQAALTLPLVYLGWAEDFWGRFDCYVEIEAGCASTFFAIPFGNRPGRSENGVAPKRRAAAYGASDIADKLRRLVAAKCEIGLHGIDAWIDSSAGRKELGIIRAVTSADEIGTRMHWLCFDEQSPVALQEAGASYDSTMGYNETIGFRAGTAQAYKPLNVTKLLELPLTIMDTALFYPAYLHLSRDTAAAKIGEIVDNTARYGGCVTVNWHDRSIAPERLWTDTYVHLLADLKEKRAWFGTAAQVTKWFRARRSARFIPDADGNVQVALPNCGESVPALTLRTYSPPDMQPIDICLSPLSSPVTLWNTTVCDETEMQSR